MFLAVGEPGAASTQKAISRHLAFRRDAGQGRESQRQIELPGLRLPPRSKAPPKLVSNLTRHLHACRPAGRWAWVQAEPGWVPGSRNPEGASNPLMKRTLRGGIKALATRRARRLRTPFSSCSPAVTESSALMLAHHAARAPKCWAPLQRPRLHGDDEGSSQVRWRWLRAMSGLCGGWRAG